MRINPIPPKQTPEEKEKDIARKVAIGVAFASVFVFFIKILFF
ncbi:hypothetical protein SAMN05421788_104403 [Filimonas lacunae]|uniref:Uncharacterized protein n=1 Tax=Filimonas lacunae TaxID=477680 RepID=A0A173MRT5_9BACT|nr:hypothetical protein [Filimonas lacunae]BAV10226.1 hypothetical protein FLA_6287 [Filimonas lacunae]SIT18068.1 hypothetical protein SAMN05421788_104403 [Filimonas lacunae]